MLLLQKRFPPFGNDEDFGVISGSDPYVLLDALAECRLMRRNLTLLQLHTEKAARCSPLNYKVIYVSELSLLGQATRFAVRDGPYLYYVRCFSLKFEVISFQGSTR